MNSLWKQLAVTMLLLSALHWTVAAQSGEPAKLPAGLSETEAQQIRKEQSPKGQVEAALRVANTLITDTLRQVHDASPEDSYKKLELYLELLTYADAAARSFSANQQKDRNKVLKLLEQAIFKQQRTFEGTRQELPYEQREASEKLAAAIKRIRLRAINDVLGNGEIIKE